MSEASESGPNVERRTRLRLREIFVEAYDVVEPFFDSANAWGGQSHQHLAFLALRERFPKLSSEDILIIVTAAKRVFGTGGKPVA
jgi:hypothetical protein